MINAALVKELRKQRSWSQDQLAEIAGISLRTVQRVEKEGTSSLESRKALAVAFEMDAADLELDLSAIEQVASNRRGTRYGYIGAATGLVASYVGITLDVLGGGMSLGEAGVYYGGVGAVVGVFAAVIGRRSARRS
jgi:transcriptional regulator with XRE-family HTH domain